MDLLLDIKLVKVENGAVKRIALVILGGIVFLAAAGVIYAQQECYDGVVPAGSIPGQPSLRFCYINDLDPSTPGYPLNTELSTENEWHDNFNHGLFNTSFTDTNYNLFYDDGAYPPDVVQQEIHWRHANHWMVDLTSTDQSDVYALLSPNRSFTVKDYAGTPNNIEDDKLIVEADDAAGHADYDSPPNASTLGAWQELVVTTNSFPTSSKLPPGGYGYNLFPGYYSFGCRLQSSRFPVCALWDTRTSPQERIWEMSAWQLIGNSTGGGNPSGGNTAPPFDNLQDYWRRCQTEGDPDTSCRDRFRMEIEKDSLTLFVNGRMYFRQWDGINPDAQYIGTGSPDDNEFFLDSFLNWGAPGSGDYHLFPKEFFYKNGDPSQGKAELYVYYSDLSNRLPETVIRYHWDNLTVNTDREPSCAESFVDPNGVNCQDVPPGPNTIPTPTPTGTPGVTGDINGDGVVNVQDFILLSNAFGTADPEADLNGDGTVNVQGFIILSNNFGS